MRNTVADETKSMSAITDESPAFRIRHDKRIFRIYLYIIRPCTRICRGVLLYSRSYVPQQLAMKSFISCSCWSALSKSFHWARLRTRLCSGYCVL